MKPGMVRILLCLGLPAAGALGAWTILNRTPAASTAKAESATLRVNKPARHVGLLIDGSDSMLGEPCAVLSGIMGWAFDLKGATKDSRIFVYFTGDERSAMEPLLLGVVSIPISTRFMEGQEALTTARNTVGADLVSACKRGHAQSRKSPVFLDMRRAIEGLQAHGCQEGTGCLLLVRSDLEETEERWIRDSLRAGRLVKRGRPEPLNNAGIAVLLCGFSETRGDIREGGKRQRLTAQRSSKSADLLASLWKSLFSDPSLVFFEPACPKAAQ